MQKHSKEPSLGDAGIKLGTTRVVFLLGTLAIKVPRGTSWRLFLNGLLANMQEREFGATGWPQLCPVLWSVPGGWLVVMRRATPLTYSEWSTFNVRKWRNRSTYVVPVENKWDSFGWVDGHIVAIDYGS